MRIWYYFQRLYLLQSGGKMHTWFADRLLSSCKPGSVPISVKYDQHKQHLSFQQWHENFANCNCTRWIQKQYRNLLQQLSVPLELPVCWLLESSFCSSALDISDAGILNMAKSWRSKAAGFLKSIIKDSSVILYFYVMLELKVQKDNIQGYIY